MDIEGVNSKANAGLTTGIIGTAGVAAGLLGLMGMGNRGAWGNWGNGMYSVNGYEAMGRCNDFEHRLNDIQVIALKDSQIAELKMNSLMDSKVLDLYKYTENKLHEIENRFAEQGVWNATANGQFGCLGAQIAELRGIGARLTKTVIPADNVCPEPMARYNSWTAPTAAAETPTA